MDVIVKGIVLKTKDYKDNDKLLTILTLEKGKILVKARGVKKAKSKLKPYCQSFCFAQFELAEGKGGYILTGVNEIESFFYLTSNIEKFSYAFSVLELVDKVCYENQQYVSIFIDTLKTLQQLKLQDVNAKLVLCKFILNTLAYEGFNLNLSVCANCGAKLEKVLFFDLTKGEIICGECKAESCVELENSVFSALRILSSNTYEQLKTIKFSQNILDKLLKFLTINLYERYEIRLKSLFL